MFTLFHFIYYVSLLTGNTGAGTIMIQIIATPSVYDPILTIENTRIPFQIIK